MTLEQMSSPPFRTDQFAPQLRPGSRTLPYHDANPNPLIPVPSVFLGMRTDSRFTTRKQTNGRSKATKTTESSRTHSGAKCFLRCATLGGSIKRELSDPGHKGQPLFIGTTLVLFASCSGLTPPLYPLGIPTHARSEPIGQQHRDAAMITSSGFHSQKLP